MAGHDKTHAGTHAPGGADDLSSGYPPRSLVTGKGSLLVASASGTIVEHVKGNAGEVPMWDPTTGDGLVNAALNEAKRYGGLLGWSFDPALSNSDTAVTVATKHLAKIPLLRSLSVTNVIVHLSTLGSTLTHSFVALYKSDGTIIGQSDDQSSIWGTGGALGLKSVALASGPFTPAPLQANDWLWAVLYVGTASAALPHFVRATNTISTSFTNLGSSAANSRAGTVAEANTATLTNLTPSAIAQSATLFWAGLS